MPVWCLACKQVPRLEFRASRFVAKSAREADSATCSRSEGSISRFWKMFRGSSFCVRRSGGPRSTREDGLFDDAVNDNASFASAFRGPETGVLAYSPAPGMPRVRHRRRFAGTLPCLRLAVHASPCGRESQRRFVRALAAGDAQMMFDGGWMAPLGQEDETRDLRQIVRALPRIPFYKVECDNQPAIVRVARREQQDLHLRGQRVCGADPDRDPAHVSGGHERAGLSARRDRS